MYNIKIVAVGKLKEAYLVDGCKEYLKRLGGYCKVELIEIEEERLSEEPGESLITAALEAEADRIFQKTKGSTVIALCIEGEKVSSEELSKRLDKYGISGKSSIAFVIGSSHGISERIKQAAELRLSMSDMTFPHQVARLMLCEQLYRAFTIMAGSKYHK